MRIVKRSGEEQIFDENKIIQAITNANKAVEEKDRLPEFQIKLIAESVKNTCAKFNRAASVEEIQDLVESEIMNQGAFNLAKKYITYRYIRGLVRQSNTTDDRILSLIECNNEEVKQENSNKNPILNSVQRDYMAGEVSVDLSKRLLLPADVVEAHNKGLIHFHDMDYYSQHSHNCFSSRTEFVTSEGVRSFKTCRDGEQVTVLTKDGEWAPATVHSYDRQAMQYVTMTSGRNSKTVKCTCNHRWLLRDGSVTTDLKVGDHLFLLPEQAEKEVKNLEAFCFGLVLGDGTDIVANGKKAGVRVRLCGDKVKYAPLLESCGYAKSTQDFGNGDLVLTKYTDRLKSEFLEHHCWKWLSSQAKADLFKGYYAADGAKNTHVLCTASDDVAQMIREISCVAGYHIVSESKEIRDTNFKKGAQLYRFGFIANQIPQRGWIVKEIKLDDHGEVYDTWCVEEPKTHSFTLAGGVVTGNCDLVALDDMLQNGTVISGTMIEKPHSFSTACNIATQIIAQVASSQYGGQSISFTHLAPFVDVSRQKIKAQLRKELVTTKAVISAEAFEEVVHSRLLEEVGKGVQTIQYQVVTLMTTNGQAPFVTFFMYLNEAKNPQEKKDLALIIEEVLKQRIRGTKNEAGVYVTPAFPKLIYVLEDDNVEPDSPYYYLTELAAKCTAKRMVPDYISEKVMRSLKIDKNGNGNVYTCMGCRSFLTPYVTEEGKPKYYGRFNQGVVTVNLPDIALSSNKDMDKFWQIFDERMELCHKALRCRHERLKGTLSDAAPILWQYGALTRLKKGETIDKYLYGGYSTISLGYAGLWETVYALIGKKLTEPEGEELGLKIMQKLNEYTAKWKAAEHIDYSLYGTPLESTTYKFAKSLQRRFGIIKGVSDRNYITNSYHVHVTEPIDAFSKLALEAKFQKLSPGGAISYVEVPNMQNNIDAVLNVMKFIYDNIMYAELNTKSDYCQVCGYDGEIQIVEEEGSGKLVWECPKCGNRDQTKLNVARRTCGYIGSQFWNQGRTQEIRERVLHL